MFSKLVLAQLLTPNDIMLEITVKGAIGVMSCSHWQPKANTKRSPYQSGSGPAGPVVSFNRACGRVEGRQQHRFVADERWSLTAMRAAAPAARRKQKDVLLAPFSNGSLLPPEPGGTLG